MTAANSTYYPSERELVAVQAAEQLMHDAMAHNDPSHDPHHVLRVRKTAMKLARGYPSADLLVVDLAALLHDVLDKKYVPAGTDARAHFAPFFAAHADVLSPERAELVLRVVEHVSWTTENRLRAEGRWGAWHDACLELHCVQDADRLDAIGAIGVMRCAAYSSHVNRALYILPGHTGQEESAVAHFHDKLLHIRDRLKTEEGKRMGEQRHQYLVQFLEQVDIERT